MNDETLLYVTFTLVKITTAMRLRSAAYNQTAAIAVNWHAQPPAHCMEFSHACY
jgi:hypothetical protein